MMMVAAAAAVAVEAVMTMAMATVTVTATVMLVINNYYIHKLTVNVKNLRAPLYFSHMKWCVV